MIKITSGSCYCYSSNYSLLSGVDPTLHPPEYILPLSCTQQYTVQPGPDEQIVLPIHQNPFHRPPVQKSTQYSLDLLSSPMRPKARETTQHESPQGWLEENDPAWQDLLMMVLLSSAQPRASKPVIKSKHQLRPGLAYVQLQVGSFRLGGYSWSVRMTPLKETPDSLCTFSLKVFHRPS
jgi:hypothetical protein